MMLFHRTKTRTEGPTQAVAEPTIEPHILLSAIAALLSRTPAPENDRLPSEIAGAFRAAYAALSAADEQSLRQTVEFSINASEAMAAMARITGEIRDTDGKAQTIAASVEELNASIDQISTTADSVAASMDIANNAMSEGAKATREAAEASRNIGQSFNSMTGAAEQLAAAASQIGTFVATIEALSQQTNLLALNATIEAARAGEAGRGFAVVAAEVKALSGQTQKATDDIRARIERLECHVREVMTSVSEVRGYVDRSVHQSEAANGQIEHVRGSIADNAVKMSEIAGMFQQQSEAVAEIASGVSSIAGHTRVSADHTNLVIAAVGASEKLINEQFADLEQKRVHNYVLLRAKSDHLLWKKRLSEMLVGLNTLKSSELSDHHQCRLGKWYDAVTDGKFRENPAFGRLPVAHEAVHRFGKMAADCHAHGDRAGAAAALIEMETASRTVLQDLDQLLLGVN
jgi:methyl-accepting chemotaxis protein